MKTQSLNHPGFRVRAAALACVGLLLAFLPDWDRQPRAQAVSSVTLTPASHDFGSVAAGSSRTTTFTVQNGLLADIDLGAVQAASPFSAASGCPGRLAPGASCAIQVTFAPTSSGNYAGTLSVVWSQIDLPPPPPGEPAPGGTLAAGLTGVGAPPPPLIVVPDSATTQAGTPVAIAVLANDSGGVPPLSISAVGSPAHGTAANNGGTILYTPAAGYSGPDSFGYTARDAVGQTASATVTVTVTPRAANDTAVTTPGTPVTINVLANDSGTGLTVTGVGAPSHGTATISGNAILYTPTAGYIGPDSFGYTIRDATGQTASATVAVTVTPSTPTGPTAVDDSATTKAGTPVTINVLANDSGGTPPLTVVSVTSPAHGTATTDGRTVTYTPAPGYSGPDSFGYTIRDATGQTAS
ncbi:MAG: Ig-like domain-containing protein, partial [Candidatus Competibacter sp.]|nr:Ig-like domain-containing protein [Candidatus Competibacter sp.]